MKYRIIYIYIYIRVHTSYGILQKIINMKLKYKKTQKIRL